MKLFGRTGLLVLVIMVALTVKGAIAVPGGEFVDSCYSSTWSANGDLTSSLKISNDCVDNSIMWTNDVNLTILGNVTDMDVSMGEDWIEVDSSLRPDLDSPATVTFASPSFAVNPDIERDGTTCTVCNMTYTGGVIEIEVPGFSNYSLTAKKDFTVYSDDEPELKSKVYQTIDLGDARRATDYACVVQVFGRNQDSEWILVQTNPERQVQARILGNPDTNQPESLGYFPTTNGMANTYFRNDNLYGYMDFELVIQCTSNASSMLIYEEPIMTRYSPAGRPLKSRGVWISDGDNAFYVTVWVVLTMLVVWLGGSFVRSIKK